MTIVESSTDTDRMSVVRGTIEWGPSTERGGEMTVARLSTHPAHHAPGMLEGIVLRLGMSLVAWSHDRSRRHQARTRSARHHRAREYAARVEAQRERALAEAALLRTI